MSWIFCGAPRLPRSFAGNLSGERCKVQHFDEHGLQGFCLFRCEQVHVINEQRIDRLFGTVCVCIDHTSHTDECGLDFGGLWWIQFEVRDIVERAKRDEFVCSCIALSMWRQSRTPSVTSLWPSAPAAETLERLVERTSTAAREHGRNIVTPATALEAALVSSGGTCWVMYCTAIV